MASVKRPHANTSTTASTTKRTLCHRNTLVAASLGDCRRPVAAAAPPLEDLDCAPPAPASLASLFPNKPRSWGRTLVSSLGSHSSRIRLRGESRPYSRLSAAITSGVSFWRTMMRCASAACKAVRVRFSTAYCTPLPSSTASSSTKMNDVRGGPTWNDTRRSPCATSPRMRSYTTRFNTSLRVSLQLLVVSYFSCGAP